MKKIFILIVMFLLTIVLTSCQQDFSSSDGELKQPELVLPPGYTEDDLVNPDDIEGDYIIVDNPDDTEGDYVHNGGSGGGNISNQNQEKHKVTYYLDGKEIYSENVVKATNYNILYNRVIIGWFTENIFTPLNSTPYVFGEELKEDISLYAVSVEIRAILDRYFTDNNITEYYFEGNSESDAYLCIKKTNDDINYNGLEYKNTGGYVAYYRYNSMDRIDSDYNMYLKNYIQWDIFGSYGCLHSIYAKSTYSFDDPYAIRNNDLLLYTSKLSFNKYSDINNVVVRDSIANYCDSDAMTKYVLNFEDILAKHLSILINDYKRVIYKDHISTSTAYTLYIDLEN